MPGQRSISEVPVTRSLDALTLAEIESAQRRIADIGIRSPLIRLEPVESQATVYLKLENLQPIGSFKLRGAGNVLRRRSPEDLRHGIYTASAGNWAQGLAWCARALGIPCSVIVPEGAPKTKVAATERLGATVLKAPYEEWWQVIVDGHYPGLDGTFVHPVADRDVVAGHGTIGLEILEDLPNVDSVIVPFGGGGLSCGIASAVRARRPSVRVYGAEVETAAPLRASIAAGSPQRVERVPSFVDGIGGSSVLPEMWPLVSTLIDESIVVSIADVTAAIRRLAERQRIVAEGAGAASVAAALTGRAGSGNIVCIVSGGNIDTDQLAGILAGEIPTSSEHAGRRS